jgi:hypothetical protein
VVSGKFQKDNAMTAYTAVTRVVTTREWSDVVGALTNENETTQPMGLSILDGELHQEDREE